MGCPTSVSNMATVFALNAQTQKKCIQLNFSVDENKRRKKSSNHRIQFRETNPFSNEFASKRHNEDFPTPLSPQTIITGAWFEGDQVCKASQSFCQRRGVVHTGMLRWVPLLIYSEEPKSAFNHVQPEK
jgi:hypothetical protein